MGQPRAPQQTMTTVDGPGQHAGDFNARIQTKLSEEEKCIGKHIFDTDDINIEEFDEWKIDNRNTLIGICDQRRKYHEHMVLIKNRKNNYIQILKS